MKKDKQRVESEEWDATRFEVFFSLKSHDETDRDFVILEKAYRSMPVPLFEQFLEIFVDRNHNLQAKNKAGQTMLEIIAKHAQSTEYLQAIQQHLN
ncbi:PA4642 family protein [Gynuella sunshinyii]|uniref:Uncharacterized protein n=1 Tax=Gynuella sunshinyii YC6258 TaxID=1445510 RepID=A0A0C5VG24_9GAMM|nr:PA4642 family protein [Gynuella sunshinyii]AJQ93557.1 hypothetical Protein YC6258_01509 [Gynuella sunshinyii YC6258]